MWGLLFGVWGLGCAPSFRERKDAQPGIPQLQRHPLGCEGFRVRARVQGSGFRVQGSGFRVQGSGFRVQVSGFRVQGLGVPCFRARALVYLTERIN